MPLTWLRENTRRPGSLIYDSPSQKLAVAGGVRKALVPRAIEGLPSKEIADVSGVPVGTVRIVAREVRRVATSCSDVWVSDSIPLPMGARGRGSFVIP
jgi:hypothetical protein